jgi:hypothetical protein
MNCKMQIAKCKLQIEEQSAHAARERRTFAERRLLGGSPIGAAPALPSQFAICNLQFAFCNALPSN